MVLGSWFLVLCSWFFVLGIGIGIGSWFLVIRWSLSSQSKNNKLNDAIEQDFMKSRI
jgi:hypothetical protein